jgi:hypothetical protein
MTDPTLTWRRRALGCDRFADRDLQTISIPTPTSRRSCRRRQRTSQRAPRRDLSGRHHTWPENVACTAGRLCVTSLALDGEAVVCWSRRGTVSEAMFYAFDLLDCGPRPLDHRAALSPREPVSLFDWLLRPSLAVISDSCRQSSSRALLFPGALARPGFPSCPLEAWPLASRAERAWMHGENVSCCLSARKYALSNLFGPRTWRPTRLALWS